MDDKERVLFCGNLHEGVTEDLLYELFLQAGPLENVKIPKEKDGRQRNYGFITFKHAVSVPYAIALMDGISLFGKALHLNARNGSEAAPNPYKEQLRQYANSLLQQQSYHQTDNRRHDNYSRRHDSRRYEMRSEGDIRFDSGNTPVIYPGYNQPFPQNFHPVQIQMAYYPRSDMYQNQRHYR